MPSSHINQVLAKACEQGIIEPAQQRALSALFASELNNQARFNFTHVLYYLGGLIAIGAMSLFMTLGWEAFGGAGIVSISLAYALVGLALSTRFAGKGLVIPAGICATFVVCLTPFATYGLQVWLGLWPDDSSYRDYHRYIQWHWLYMELATLAVGVVLAWHFKYPFMVMPIALTLWYLSMDLAAMISGGDLSWALRKLVSLYVGLLMTLLAFWVELRSQRSSGHEDYAFWLYLFGVMAFWGGLSSMQSDSELAKFGYFMTNILLIGIGVLLVRRVFVVFGALGVSAYLGHLAFDVFEDSWLFPIVLSAIGLAVIYLGVLWQKHEQALSQYARRHLLGGLPAALRKLLKARV